MNGNAELKTPRDERGGAILKIVGGLLLVGILGIGALGFYAYTQKDAWIRAAVEKTLEHLFETDVALAEAKLEIAEQQISFQELSIANPPGYESDKALSFGSILTKADVKSFNTDVPTVNLIELKSPEFVYERKLKSSNITDLIDSVSRFGEEGETEPATETAEESQVAIRIDKVVIEKASVNVTVPMTGGQTLGITLGRIELNALGGGEPILPAKALLIVLRAVLEAVVNSNELTAKLGDAAGEVKALLQGEIANVSGAILAMPGAAVDNLKAAGTKTVEAAEAVAQKGAEAVTAVGDSAQAAAANVTKSTKKAADDLTSKTAEISNQVSESVDEGVEKVKEEFENVRESAGEAVDEARNKVRNIFGSGDKKKDE